MRRRQEAGASVWARLGAEPGLTAICSDLDALVFDETWLDHA